MHIIPCMMFIYFQHAVLFLKVVLSYVIPDAPDWVETALARQEYQSKRAWRKDVSLTKHVHSYTTYLQTIRKVYTPFKCIAWQSGGHLNITILDTEALIRKPSIQFNLYFESNT